MLMNGLYNQFVKELIVFHIDKSKFWNSLDYIDSSVRETDESRLNSVDECSRCLSTASHTCQLG